MQFFKKLWKILENKRILNLPQHKKEDTIWFQNQIIILQGFSQKSLLAIETKKTEIINVYIKADYIYKDNAEDVETSFDY